MKSCMNQGIYFNQNAENRCKPTASHQQAKCNPTAHEVSGVSDVSWGPNCNTMSCWCTKDFTYSKTNCSLFFHFSNAARTNMLWRKAIEGNERQWSKRGVSCWTPEEQLCCKEHQKLTQIQYQLWQQHQQHISASAAMMHGLHNTHAQQLMTPESKLMHYCTHAANRLLDESKVDHLQKVLFH